MDFHKGLEDCVKRSQFAKVFGKFDLTGDNWNRYIGTVDLEIGGYQAPIRSPSSDTFVSPITGVQGLC